MKTRPHTPKRDDVVVEIKGNFNCRSSSPCVEIHFAGGTRVSVGGFFSQNNKAAHVSYKDNLPVEDFYKSQNHLG